MKAINATLFPLILVGLLAALTFWLERASNPDNPARKAAKRHDPDFIIGQINMRHFDERGTLKQALLADTMTHYPDDDSSLIAKPNLTYYLGSSSTHLAANTAQVSQDNKRVFLHGDVRLTKPPIDGRPATVLQTDTMTVFPDDDVAISNSHVTISQGQTVVSGNSINYNGKTSVSVLTGSVKGTFYRAKKS